MSKMWEIHGNPSGASPRRVFFAATPRHAASRRGPIAASPASAAGGAGGPSHVPDLVAAVSENLRDKWSQEEPRGAKWPELSGNKLKISKDIDVNRVRQENPLD